MQEFEELWAIQQRVLERLNRTDETSSGLSSSARSAIALEKSGRIDHLPAVAHHAFDPETASPAEIDAWLKAYHQGMPA